MKTFFKPWLFNERGGPALIPLIIGAAVGFGVEQIASSFNKGGASVHPQAPSAPSQSVSNTSAAATVADQRAALLTSGGVTDYTGGLGVLIGSDISQSKLIGS